MVLESTVICFDNSDWVRNTDYSPNRFFAMANSIVKLASNRLLDNAESTVGLLSMAGNNVQLITSPCSDNSKISAAFHNTTVKGKVDLINSLLIAQLSLKHRKNKNGNQRIILYICSPIFCTTEELIKVAKSLKKNNIAVDVITMGESEENHERLEQFISTVNNNDNSHYVSIPPNSDIDDFLRSSPIYLNSSSASSAGGFDLGFDEENDPELAMVLRVSAEEARVKAEKEAKERAAALAEGKGENKEEDDEYSLMQKALELSMAEASKSSDNKDGEKKEDTIEYAQMQKAFQMSMAEATDEYLDEDEELQRALALSLQEAGNYANDEEEQQKDNKKEEEIREEEKTNKRKQEDE